MIIAYNFIAGLVLLYIGGEALVRSASTIGVRFGMTPMVVGLTIVAFATSAPEVAVSIGAALREESGLAVGNVIGSNLCNITLIVGIVVLICEPRLRHRLVRSDVGFLALASILAPALLLDGLLTRIEGVSLLLSIAAYIAITVWRVHTRRTGDPEDAHTVPAISDKLLMNILLSAGGVALLVLGSDLLVDGSISIAIAIGVSPGVVGLSAAAFGTSLPEIAASIVAARHGQAEMAVGNIIGSNIFNLLLVLGATTLVHPLTLGDITIVDIGIMIAATVLSLVLMVTRARMRRLEGAFLISVYVGYITLLFSTTALP